MEKKREKFSKLNDRKFKSAIALAAFKCDLKSLAVFFGCCFQIHTMQSAGAGTIAAAAAVFYFCCK